MRQRGFTLVELLVVIVIIGILGTLGGATYMKSMSRARDAKRVSDMQTVQKIFETYYSIYGTYATTGCADMFLPNTGVRPTPPKGNLLYFGTCTSTGYTYCSPLENGADSGNYICNPVTATEVTRCSLGTVNPTHFCVTNVQ